MAGSGFEPELQYKNVQLFKTEMLGRGSYSAVCRAKCDELPCAAKLLYPVLFDIPDESLVIGSVREHRRPYVRFEQECQFLRQLKHPNIVQYLGTYRDSENNAPVLLMELMDESLTHFLKVSSQAVPLHIQVDICHDIVLALAFLHSNGVIHRDLSSNNVLLMAGSRAKVTDFGMSTIIDDANPSSQTLCPGTVGYMAPEALNEPPVYSEKLDVFSFGVLVVQILVRLFPAPTDRFTSIEVSDPRNPRLRTFAKFEVPEIERRKSHIEKIDSGEPLLPIAQLCLKDRDQDRPTAQDLCNTIEAIKVKQKYVDSVLKKPNIITEDRDENLERRIKELKDEQEELKQQHESELESLRNQLEEAQQEIESKDQLLSIRVSQLRRLNQSLSDRETEYKALREEIERTSAEHENTVFKLQRMLSESGHSNERVHQQLNVQDQTVHDLQVIIQNQQDELKQVRDELAAEKQTNAKISNDLEMLLRVRDGEAREHRDLIHTSQLKTNRIEQELRKKERELRDLQSYVTAKDDHVRALQNRLQLIERGGRVSPRLDVVSAQVQELMVSHSTLKFSWRRGPSAPSRIHAGSSSVIGDKAYFRPISSEEVFMFSSQSEKWNQVVTCPSSAFTLTALNMTLTAVGGRCNKKLLSLIKDASGKKWIERYPQMASERFNAIVIESSDRLIVAGGIDSDWNTLYSVEVMDKRTHEWFSASSLPYSIHSASAVIIDDNLYVVGGYYMKSRAIYSVLVCSLRTLRGSEAPITNGSFSSLTRLNSQVKVWSKITDLPVCRSTCTAIGGHLLAVGGRDAKDNHMDTIFKYNPSTKMWETVSHMKVARSDCFVEVLPNNELLIVGGYTDNGLTDSVEIAMIDIK